MSDLDIALSEYGPVCMRPCGKETYAAQKFAIPDSSRGTYQGKRADTVRLPNGQRELAPTNDFIDWLLNQAPDYPKSLGGSK
jgi:hypothetical protein